MRAVCPRNEEYFKSEFFWLEVCFIFQMNYPEMNCLKDEGEILFVCLK